MKLPRIAPRALFSTRRRTAVILIGLALAAVSVVYTWSVSTKMRHEDEMAVEQLKRNDKNAVEMWVDIIKSLDGGGYYMSYNGDTQEVLNELAKHTNIPLIIINEARHEVVVSNLGEEVLHDANLREERLEYLASQNKPIPISIGPFGSTVMTIYYGTVDYSYLISSAHSEALSAFPYVQLVIIIIFAIFAYIAFLSTKQNEQNRVWVGLAKETAHQLGTPTSSLLGWVEYLRSQPVDQMAVDEMSKDLTHLLKVVDRFSKIGSETQLRVVNINEVVGDTVIYFRRRVPRNVTLTYNGLAQAPIRAAVNDALFEWVVENLLKNALDALQGQGDIKIDIAETDSCVYLDVSDTGKGIAKGNWTRIFEPGFTTKTRGWGLGLSLSRRIIEEYHRGKIAVLRSEVGKGTTIRITLKRVDDNEQ